MGAPIKNLDAVEQTGAEALLSALESVTPSERRRHASVYNYWLSIRGDRPFPTVRDLDPLELSDAGPSSFLLELTGAGEDAEIRHVGLMLRAGADVDKVSEVAEPSVLHCARQRLAEVAATRAAVAFEDEFGAAERSTRCWVTLLPFSSTGEVVDYVYGFVSLRGQSASVDEDCESEGVNAMEQVEQVEQVEQAEDVEQVEDSAEGDAEAAAEPIEEPAAEAAFTGVLADRLAETRAMAEEARLARLRVETSLCEALSAAYDFASDAEGDANEYLRLVDAHGLKIQLRSPMAPVVRLAFDGTCDEATIADLETVMDWALRSNMPRGTLAERIAAEGGFASALKAATQS